MVEEKKPAESPSDNQADKEKDKEENNPQEKESASAKTAIGKEDEDDDKKEVEVPEKFKSLVEKIEKMSVLDLAELVKILEKKFGVSAAAAVPAAVVQAGAANESEAGGAEEKNAFKVELKAVGDKKIEVIKVVRDLMGKGLKEAKDLVDAVAGGPQVIKENAKKEEAEEIKKKFETAGASVELK
jgi:large subunit ribosomal protein L7/L12